MTPLVVARVEPSIDDPFLVLPILPDPQTIAAVGSSWRRAHMLCCGFDVGVEVEFGVGEPVWPSLTGSRSRSQLQRLHRGQNHASSSESEHWAPSFGRMPTKTQHLCHVSDSSDIDVQNKQVLASWIEYG